MGLGRWLKTQWDRALAIVLALGGLISCLLGWFGVSRSVLATEQIPYLASGGLIGLCLIGLGATLWLSADLRDEWRVLDGIRRDAAEKDPVPNEAPDRTSSNGAESGQASDAPSPPRRRRRVPMSADG
jgi:hypothetical protein